MVAVARKVLDVPDADWNELNRDATFKMKYKQRSSLRANRRAWSRDMATSGRCYPLDPDLDTDRGAAFLAAQVG